MSLTPRRKDLFSPFLSVSGVLPVAFNMSTCTTDNSTTPAMTPATGVNHPPAAMFVSVTTAGTFVFRDLNNTVNSMSLPVGGHYLPWSARQIDVGTAIGTVTVVWNPSVNAK